MELEFTEIKADPLIVLNIKVDTSLIRISDEKVLFTRPFTHNNLRKKRTRRLGEPIFSPDSSHSFFSLAANDAALLRKELERSYEYLGNEIFKFYQPAIRGKYSGR